MPDYVVLRDLSRPRTRGPLEAPAAPAEVPRDVPAEPQFETHSMSKDEVRSLARDPEVRAIARVMPTTLVQPVEESEAADQDDAWGIGAIGADASTRTGAGVVVSVLDTGIDSGHEAFAGVELVEKDFTGSGNGDAQGHGTHCAGTVFGRDVGTSRIGVARGVPKALIGKVLGDDGRGDSDMLFRGMQWAVQEGARVISMSLGFDFPGLVRRLVEEQGFPVDLATSAALEAYRSNLRMFDAIMQLVRGQEAFTGGVLVVAAAGNESKRNLNPDHEIGVSLPAAADGVVSVGALGEGGAGLVIAPFSNTFPVIAGPGVRILSAKTKGGLSTKSGTSMATPHVAGVAALWWEEIGDSSLPVTATTVLAKLLAVADTSALAAQIDIADRGVGLVRSP
jgi:subtilisin family serine protease